VRTSLHSRSKISLAVTLCLLGAFGGAFAVAFANGPAPQDSAAPKQESPLDFETYRTRIEPIFLKPRENGVRCYDCHSTLNTRLHLEPLPAGSSSWTEAESRKNFTHVAQLVAPGDPLKSRLLLHPLAAEAAGDPAHGGGKFWKSQSDLEWQMLADWVRHAKAAAPPPTSAPAATKGDLDFALFKSSVQPIFLKERPGRARCYGCHTASSRVFHLAAFSPGQTEWTEEQSQLNFQSASQLVLPGKPQLSRLLTHPLAPEAGGDAFHSGGRQFASQEDPDWQAMADWVRSGAAPNSAGSSSAPAVRIYVTNSAGNTVDVIDAAQNQVVQVIHGIELPHGVAFSPDAKRVYISNESENVLDVVDRESGQILKKVSLSGHPNNLTITKDGARVLVGIRQDPGSVDVIDTKSLERTKSIPVDGSVHNVYVTSDGKFAVSGSIENKAATVIDLSTEKMVWVVKFDRPVRPMTFEANPDGSTWRIFVQLSGFNGFAAVDFAAQKEVARIQLPDDPGGFGTSEERLGTPSHGIGVAPDGKSLWVNSTLANATFKYSLPDLQLVGHCNLPLVQPANHAPTGAVPEWITFTPDSARVYVSNSGARSVSVIDAKTLKLIDVVNVGEVPKRINMLVIPSGLRQND
jgi:YVTN family beta-propeller protein